MRIRTVLFFLLPIAFLCGCGIDDYLYLYPVSSISPKDGSCEFIVPTAQEDLGDFFESYRIYYRIYQSNELLVGSLGSDRYDLINKKLKPHINKLSKYLYSEDNAPTNIQSVFLDTGFYILEYDNDSRVLSGSSIHGKKFIIDFSFGEDNKVTLGILDGIQYGLLRNTSLTDVTPKDNTGQSIYQLIHDDGIGGPDVESAEYKKYSYIVLYILAQGRDTNGRIVFSSPSMLGVYLLPNKS